MKRQIALDPQMLSHERDDADDREGEPNQAHGKNAPSARLGAGGASMRALRRLAGSTSPRLGEAKRRFPA
jgi:hypothetical protein